MASGVEKRFSVSSSIGSRGRTCCWMPWRYESGTSFGPGFSPVALRGRAAFVGGVSGEENARGDVPGSDEEDEECVDGEGSR